jgi:putative spermidine/putrescine transport system permease protein
LKHNYFVSIITALVYIFLIGPLFIIAGASFGTEEYLQFPPKGFTLHWFQNILEVGNFLPACAVSIEIAILATVIALLIGVPSAYAFSRFSFPGKKVMNIIFQSPILVPGIVMGFILMRYIIVQFNLPVLLSLLVGHTLLVIPYVMRNVCASLSNFDPSVEEAAMSLGANRAVVICRIVLPNIKSGILAACILSIVNSFNNVPLSVFLSGPGVTTLPISMLNYVEYHFDPTVAALSTVLMLVTVVIMLIVDKTLGLKSIA